MDTPKSIHMLMVGMPLKTYQEMQKELKRRLKEWDPKVLFVSFSTETFDKTVSLVMTSSRLDIVYICNIIEPSFSRMLANCEVLARKMAERPDKSWVWLNPAVNYLFPTFRNYRVHGPSGEIEAIVEARLEFRERIAHLRERRLG